MKGITRRAGLGLLMGALAARGAARAQEAFTPQAFLVLVNDVCQQVDAMEGQVEGSVPAPDAAAAAEAMAFLAGNLPQLFDWMQKIEDGVAKPASEAEYEQVAAAVRRTRDCGERFRGFIEEWARKFGPDLGTGSGQGTADLAAWSGHRAEVHWHWAAILTLAAAFLRSFAPRD